jgi:DNA invertase Pin-like site-specific DNA recombinase
MPEDNSSKNAVAAIRVSTTKQGTDGDSPEAQKEQIERYAENKGIVIKKFFVFLESASKEQQPMQEAIDYCKDPKNEVELFIIKSIDRFTRGGSEGIPNRAPTFRTSEFLPREKDSEPAMTDERTTVISVTSPATSTRVKSDS